MEQMIQSIFIEILNMSLTASVIILTVFWARIPLKKAPGIYSYVLWGIVLFRLLCPFSFESEFSLLGVLQSQSAVEGRMEYIPQDIGYQMEPQVNLPVEAANDVVNHSLPAGNPQGSVNPMQIILYLAVRIWIFGILALLLYSGISLHKLQKCLKSAVWERDNIYRMSGSISPFVYGILRPRIYLPKELSENELEYMLLHEQIHIKRGDQIYRMLAYLALCIHWFNPLVWAAFSSSGRDMEISCDEAVIRKMGSGVKKEYSASLLNLAHGSKIVKGIPLAFGESDTGSRIKHVLKYKKPAKFFAVTAVIVCVILAVALLANPAKETERIKVLRRGFDTDYQGENRFLFAILEGLAEGAGIADTIEIYHHDPAIDGQENSHEDGSLKAKEALNPENPKDGIYSVSVRSIARSAGCIDRYVADSTSDISTEQAELFFAENCDFFINEEMTSVHYKEVSFDEFVDCATWNERGGYASCNLTFQKGLITKAEMVNPLGKYGISYQGGVSHDYWYDHIVTIGEEEGVDALETYYTLVDTITMELSEFEKGEETIEIYTGNIGDGDSGLVLFKNAQGKVLHSESAHHARAGWNNIYLVEDNGKACILTVYIEDRETYGGYGYQVYEIGPMGVPLQRAGTLFEWGDLFTYDDELFREWVSGMEYYLERSKLLLSSQEGEIRTEHISELDKYNYETLKRE